MHHTHSPLCIDVNVNIGHFRASLPNVVVEGGRLCLAAGALATEFPGEKGVHPRDCLLVDVPYPSELGLFAGSVAHQWSLLWAESRSSAGAVRAARAEHLQCPLAERNEAHRHTECAVCSLLIHIL